MASFLLFLADAMRLACLALALFGLVGCASVVDVEPVNIATSVLPKQSPIIGDAGSDDMVLGLAFSGGGTRAAAFAHGVLEELEATRIGRGRSLVETVDVVSGVSGGSVTAAYFALKGRAALADFRERFPLRNVVADLKTDIDLANILTAWRYGVVNDRKGLPRWLDANLFDGATFGTLGARPGLTLLVNASDIYNRIPFVFSYETFNALCSDLDRYPLADAVAASAAVPVAFTPVVLRSYPQACDYATPFWMERTLAATDPASLGLRALAEGLKRYRDAEVMRYVKLVDGGVTDNFGLQGFILSRAAAKNAYRPPTPGRAVRLRRFVFSSSTPGVGRAASGRRRPSAPPAR
ncbi:patatin-like phospholipase family protein [Chelatococcus sp. SYSU_G07232]|uniref:Patatin-like phospholipase family protein n=1 Tax=Chelatococcus albus TaxID=3047466 RepID=A0ABT7AIS0_9HYPH|nr:patatin-like phospholipase family protein [Chelatococcus sp. SYSU_G07232]MDJ1158694.1 patatin-like phospholipase family protein [Chelatococcus sp. SYSU_G07232]